MKRLIIISRVNPEGEKNEFKVVFGFEENTSPVTLLDGRILVYDGEKFLAKKIVDRDRVIDSDSIFQKVKAVIDNVSDNTLDTYIAYHPGRFSFDITKELKTIDGVKDVKPYSSTDHQSKIKALLENPDSLEEFIGQFFTNDLLEAKLNLLHDCLSYEPSDDWDSFKNLVDHFNDEDKDKWYIFKEKKDIDSLKALRDQLLGA